MLKVENLNFLDFLKLIFLEFCFCICFKLKSFKGLRGK